MDSDEFTKCAVPELSASRESGGQTGGQREMERGCRSMASGGTHGFPTRMATVCPAKSGALPAALQGEL